MNIKAHLLRAFAAMFLIAGAAHATAIRYELTGNLTGELDGVQLKGNTFDIVLVSDTSTSAPDPDGSGFRNVATSASIRLSGYGSGVFLPFNSGSALGIATAPSIGGIKFFYDTGFTFQIIGISHQALSSWDLVTPIGPLTPTISILQVRDAGPVQTTFGILKIIGATNLTFTATVGGDPTVQATSVVFAEFADGKFPDGSFYRSTLMVQSDSSSAIQCTAKLLGLTVPGFGDGSTLTFTLRGSGGYTIVSTAGTQKLSSGYATLNCDSAVSAQVLYSYFAPSGALLSEATVFPSAGATTAQLLADQRNGARLALAITNTSSIATDFQIVALDDNNSEVNRATVSVPAQSQVSQFLNEMMAMPANFVGRVVITTNPTIFGSVYTIGFRFTGQAFTTIPATSINYR